MIDFFHKGASMTKRVQGIAKIKGAPEIMARPPVKLSKIATFKDGEDVIKRILLEVASTPEERSRGMMGRESLPKLCGMLFEGLGGGGFFWMKNCRIPLDVIFINEKGFITGICSMPVDKDGTRRYRYGDDVRSAIEVNLGLCDKWRIAKGSKVIVSEIDNG